MIAETTRTQTDLIIDRLADVERRARELKSVGATLDDEVRTMRDIAHAGQAFAVECVTAEAKAAGRLVTDLSDRINEARALRDRRAIDGVPPTEPDILDARVLDLLQEREHRAADARADAARLDDALATADRWLAAILEPAGRRIHAVAIVARSVRVERAAARVRAMRDDLKRLRDGLADDGDLGGLLADFERRAGHPLPVGAVTWPPCKLAEPQMTEPQMTEPTP